MIKSGRANDINYKKDDDQINIQIDNEWTH